MKNIRLLIAVLFFPLAAMAKDYNASLFSIYSDGITNNTGSIQKAIDFISENGGGRLVFYVGKYITGTIYLKSNVSIKLEEGAVLVGASSIYEYGKSDAAKAIIVADGQSNIGISGKGVIDGNATSFNQNMQKLVSNNYLPAQTTKPALISFSNCSNITIDSVNLWQSANSAILLNTCNNIAIDLINIDGKKNPESKGILLYNINKLQLKNTFIDVVISPVSKTGNNTEVQITNTINSTGKAIK